MKHQCKTMLDVWHGIKEFNEAVDGVAPMLNLRLYESADEKSGMMFSVLFCGSKGKWRKKKVYQGYGFRWLYCPFCGEKI